MKKLNDEDIQAYFLAGNSGFWKVESEEGKKTRLYTDEITDELFGITEDLSPEKCMEYVAEHIYPQERECFWDYMEELKSHESEAVYRYMHPVKGVIYIRCTGRRVSSPDNMIRLVGYHLEAGNIVHFEKEKLLENRLLQQNQQLKDENKNQIFYYKELLDTISVGVLSYTLPEHEIVHMNAEAMRIYGVETIEEAQENLGRLIGAVSYLNQNVIEKLMDMRYHDGAVSYECVIPDRKGNLTPAIAKTEIFYTSNGKKTILTTFLDISENVTLKKSLKEAQASNAVISAISKIYWTIYSMDLRTDSFEEVVGGEVMHRLTGSHGCASEAFRTARKSVISKEDQQSMREFFDVTTLADRLKQEETIAREYLAADGHWHMGRFIVKQRDANGTVTEVLYVARDITEEKKQEFEYQEQLKRTAQEAEKANVSKTDFLRRMSHDIRTPINGICGITQIANHFPKDLQKQQECRDKVLTASGFLLNLVNDILDVNKMESGTLQLEEKIFDLRKVLSESSGIVEMQGREKGISLSLGAINIIHSQLVGSPLHLQQILQNIGSNAVNYNHVGGKIVVSCQEISSDDRTAVFEFTCTDNGIGMSEEFQKHLFEPFTQENRLEQNASMGTGLGMTIVSQLVTMMGGQICFTSKVDEGTSFVITLPFRIVADMELKMPESSGENVSLKGKRALLVEDNELNMEIAQFILENENMKVSCAWNGKEAVDIFARSKPGEYDLILMDIMMPVMDGLEAARQIRAMDRPDAKLIPIVAMSANAFQDDVERSKKAGINKHIAKPLTGESVIREIKSML